MVDLVNHLLHFALWSFFVIFAFAVFGFIVALRWLIRLFTQTKTAVGSGIDSAERAVHLK